MKIQMLKQAGGVLIPLDDMQAEALQKLKTGEQYEIDINLKINPVLHRKLWSFFKFCFDYWCADNGFQQYASEKHQLESFRKHLLIQAGHCEMVFDFNNPGQFKLEAKSISYKDLNDDLKRRDLYVAVTQAAISTVFKDCKDENIINRLYAFF